MKILIIGIDGYLGWPTAMHLSENHEIYGIDNFSKRKIELELDIKPLNDLPTMRQRVDSFNTKSSKDIKFTFGDLTNHRFVYDYLNEVKPDVIIHYGEQPSAPYSMAGRTEAYFTQHNNVLGTLNLLFAVKKYCPDCHIIKLGTMGEYGTPNIDIEEGWFDYNHNGRSDRLLFPKKPGSFYHLSKVHDSNNLEFACRVWGMRCTDLNQGVVYGTRTLSQDGLNDPILDTSFHYDHCFGTVLNRFMTLAAMKKNLTVFGAGKHIRSFLNINDTLNCVSIAIDNPAKPGEFRVRNQFTETFSMNELALLVKESAKDIDIEIDIDHINNPRVEDEEHHYNPSNKSFIELGLKPIKLSSEFIQKNILYIQKYLQNIDEKILHPSINWKN